MKRCFVMAIALVTSAWADVSHLGKYNYPVPASNEVLNAPPKPQTHLHSAAQIESIKPSVHLTSFSLQQNIGQGQDFGSQSYSNSQFSEASNYNLPVQQQYSAPAQQQSYSAAASTPIQQTYSAKTAGFVQNTYLPPAPQQEYAPLQQQSHYVPAPGSIQQSYLIPAAIQNSYLPPAPQQQITAPAPIQQQTYSNPNSPQIVQQSFSAPVSSLAQEKYSSFSENQQQSYVVAEEQQQHSLGSVELTSSVGNDTYSYQAPVQQQSLSTAVSMPVQQIFSTPSTNPVQQSYPVPSTAQVQSLTFSNAVGSTFYNFQPSQPRQQQTSESASASAPVQRSQTLSVSASAPLHQALTPSAVPAQQQYSTSIQQSHSAPVSVSPSIETGPYNYQPVIGAQLALALAQNSYTASAPISPSMEYSTLQKNSFAAPVSELAAPAPTSSIGTVYDKNSGYRYHKF